MYDYTAQLAVALMALLLLGTVIVYQRYVDRLRAEIDYLAEELDERDLQDAINRHPAGWNNGPSNVRVLKAVR